VKKATISQTKNDLSALLDRVRHGETVLIVDRSRPVARLVPVWEAGRGAAAGRLERLERAGLARRGSGRVVEEILRREPPRAGKGGDILEALLSERRESR